MSTLDSHNDGSRTQSNPAQACAGFFCQVEVRHLVEHVAHFYHPRLSAATRGQWPSLLAGRTSGRYARIAEQQNPDLWLSTQLALADTWGWQAPEQLEFLLVQSLKETDGTLAERWQARPDETPAAHFERVYQATQFWQGDAPL